MGKFNDIRSTISSIAGIDIFCYAEPMGGRNQILGMTSRGLAPLFARAWTSNIEPEATVKNPPTPTLELPALRTGVEIPRTRLWNYCHASTGVCLGLGSVVPERPGALSTRVGRASALVRNRLDLG